MFGFHTGRPRRLPRTGRSWGSQWGGICVKGVPDLVRVSACELLLFSAYPFLFCSLELPGEAGDSAGCAEMGAGTPCGRTRWGHAWSSLRGTKRVTGAPTWARGRHVDAPVGAMGRAPWGGARRA